MADAVLIDTWGWLALGHRRDSHHQEIKALSGGICKKFHESLGSASVSEDLRLAQSRSPVPLLSALMATS